MTSVVISLWKELLVSASILILTHKRLISVNPLVWYGVSVAPMTGYMWTP